MTEHQDRTLTGRVDVLEHTVGELRVAFVDLAKEVRRFMERTNEQPRPIPFKEIITTAAATLGLVVGILSFLDARVDTKLEAKNAPMAVIQYRIDQLEKKPH